MTFLSNIAHGLSSYVHSFWPHSTPTENNTDTGAIATEDQQETPSQPQVEDHPSVPIATPTGEHVHLPLPVLMNMFRLSTTAQYEGRSRTIYNEIEKTSGNLKKLDAFLAAFSKELCDKKKVNLTLEPFSKFTPELKELGITLPTASTVTVEDASSLMRSWEHTREGFDQDMKMKYHKFAELSKDRETVMQAFISMDSSLNDAIKKVTRGIG